MLIRHACGHDVEMPHVYAEEMVAWGKRHLCSECQELPDGSAIRVGTRRDQIATQIACTLAERYVYGTEAHLDNWAATAVKMADRLMEELEKPR